MEAGSKMGFTISSKEFLHEKGLINMRNIRNAMGGDTFEENDEAAKRGLPFWITEPDLEAEVQQYIDDDVVPATKEHADHRGSAYRAMAQDTWYKQDDGTAGASMEHVLIALMQRFPNVRGDSDGVNGMLQMVQGKRRVHSYNRERNAAGMRAGEDMDAGLQITLAIDGTSNKNVPGLNMADLRTQLSERRRIEKDAGVDWDWDSYLRVSEALDEALAIRATHANRSGSEVYSADERRSLTSGNTVAPVERQDKAMVVAPVGETRGQGDSVDEKILKFHERMVAPKLDKMQGELGELASAMGSLAGSVKGIESNVETLASSIESMFTKGLQGMQTVLQSEVVAAVQAASPAKAGAAAPTVAPDPPQQQQPQGQQQQWQPQQQVQWQPPQWQPQGQMPAQQWQQQPQMMVPPWQQQQMMMQAPPWQQQQARQGQAQPQGWGGPGTAPPGTLLASGKYAPPAGAQWTAEGLAICLKCGKAGAAYPKLRSAKTLQAQ